MVTFSAQFVVDDFCNVAIYIHKYFVKVNYTCNKPISCINGIR